MRSLVKRFFDTVFGRPLALRELEDNQIGVAGGIPALGLDGLASAAYGPEAALAVLLPLGAVGIAYALPIIGCICLLLAILYFSYCQTISAYPTGGGSFTVAKANLGTQAGLLAAAALLVDYVLNVAVGISAGVGALISAIPGLQSFTVPMCLGILLVITLVNLRGIGESSKAFGPPTYAFIVTLVLALGLGAWRTFMAHGHPHALVPHPAQHAALRAVSLWLLLKAFAAGCTAMTGVEAVSNGVTAFREPRVKNAQGTLTVIVGTLLVLLVGIAFLTRAYGIGAMNPSVKGYQSVISQLVEAVVGRGWFYYLTIGAVLAVLCLSANTSFSGFPRLCRIVAENDFLPHLFANVGRRLVYSSGICILALFSAVLIIVFEGITDRLIPLFAVGAFLAFTLSQAGMVVHWKREGTSSRHRIALCLNALGTVCTTIALIIILVAKFTEGAWLTVLIIPSLVWFFNRIKAHYDEVTHQIQLQHPFDLDRHIEPIVVLPILSWNRVTAKALRFAASLSAQIEVLYVSSDPEREKALRADWEKSVAPVFVRLNRPVPRLVVLSSPYRLFYEPLRAHIMGLRTQAPDDFVTVIVPEMVQRQWYDSLLHNHRALRLKYELLFEGDPHIVVLNVPWYLSAAGEPIKETASAEPKVETRAAAE